MSNSFVIRDGYAYANTHARNYFFFYACEELHGKVFYDKLMTCYKHKFSNLEIK